MITTNNIESREISWPLSSAIKISVSSCKKPRIFDSLVLSTQKSHLLLLLAVTMRKSTENNLKMLTIIYASIEALFMLMSQEKINKRKAAV